MWLQNLANTSLYGVPLLVVLLCGLAGVLLDLDHPVAHWFGIRNGRFLHIPVLIGSGAVFLLVVASGGRLLAG